jgi:hypothetical protein
MEFLVLEELWGDEKEFEFAELVHLEDFAFDLEG